jgi:OmcA/MtrC family decaheme c-type cytochrome
VAGIGYTYGIGTITAATNTQPLTQTNVPGYPYIPKTTTLGTGQGGVSVPAPNVYKNLATNPDSTPFAGRRAIVTTAKCNDCHNKLGIFTEKVFHAGQRNDGPTCSWCHNVNRVNSGWSVNIKDAVHAIHASGKRVNKFSWEATAGDKYWEITYPGVLNNCEACHVAGSYDFSNATNAAAVPNLLWSTTATGAVNAAAFSIKTGSEVVTSASSVISPFIDPNNASHVLNALPLGGNYGAGFTTNFATSNLAAPYVDAAATTLVSSPIVAACSNCHDTSAAISHFKQNGGAFYEPRATALAKVESCLVCHGSGAIADIKAIHMSFK